MKVSRFLFSIIRSSIFIHFLSIVEAKASQEAIPPLLLKGGCTLDDFLVRIYSKNFSEEDRRWGSEKLERVLIIFLKKNYLSNDCPTQILNSVIVSVSILFVL